MTPVARARLAAWAGSLVSTRSRGIGRVGEAGRHRLFAALTSAAATVGVVALIYPPRWSPGDDAFVLRQANELGLAALFTPLHYLVVVQRAASLLQGPDPVLIGTLACYAAVAVVAVFLAWRVHPAMVLALVLVPAWSVYNTLSDIQWILAVYLLGMLVASPPTSTKGRMADAFGLLACGLTGPFSVLFLPLYAIRARNPVWRWHLFFLGYAAVFQVATMLSVHRAPGPTHDTLAVMLARASLPVGIILLGGLRQPRIRVAAALSVAVGMAFLGINATYHTTDELLAGAGIRYFYLPWVVAIGMAVLAILEAQARWRRSGRPSSRGRTAVPVSPS